MSLFYREKGRLIKENKLLSDNLLTSMSYEGIWIYTLKKSGTTYTLLFLSNYLNLLYGNGKEVDFDEMQSNFFFHSAENKIKTCDIGKELLNRKHLSDKIPNVIHSHTALNYDFWEKCICLYRNPLDFVVSSFFFHKLKRGKSTKHPRKILPRRLKAFGETYKKQLQLEKDFSGSCLRLSYEELIKNPFEVFSKMLKFIGLPYHEDMVMKAMENSSKDKVKEMEKKRGAAIVVPEGLKFKGSFINNGKIGQWKAFFNDKDLRNAETILNDFDLSLNDFVLE